jgi:dTDP-4-amino-4,6-dideoxygalactose transaminase
MIPFLDVEAAYRELKPDIDAAVQRVLESGLYILGPEVEAFEKNFAAAVNAKHCVGLGNGLDALALSLIALDVGKGDEVIVPSNTYIATWLAVEMAGATVVPVEPDPLTHCIDPARVEEAITERTRVLLPVHLYGNSADLDPLRDICNRRNLHLLEDAAQAHGARYKGQMVGCSEGLVAWSFYPGKNLGAFGDGGAITTNDSKLAKKVALLRNYGSQEKYINVVKGRNSRLAPIQAATLGVKLPYLMQWNKRREKIADIYTDGLTDTSLGLPQPRQPGEQAWHLYVIRSRHRNSLQQALMDRGIQTLIHYPIPPFKQEAYASMSSRAREWPIACQLATEVLSLPMGPHLSSDDARTVVATLRELEGAWDT